MRKQADELYAVAVHDGAFQVHRGCDGDHPRLRVCGARRSRRVIGESQHLQIYVEATIAFTLLVAIGIIIMGFIAATVTECTCRDWGSRV
jgi:hypothetical protein